MRKILTLVLSLMLALGFCVSITGCKDKINEIVVLSHRTDLKNTLLAQAKTEFEKKYADKGWKVSFETYTDYEGDVTTRISGNNYGDVLMLPNSVEDKDFSKKFLSYGTVDELRAEGWLCITAKQYQNQVYGLPSGCTVAGILYNIAVFEAAGVDASKLNSAEKFLQAMETVQEYGRKNITDWKGAFYTHTAEGWPCTQWPSAILTSSGNVNYMNNILPWDTKAFWDSEKDEAGKVGRIYNLMYDLIVNDVVEQSPVEKNWESSKIWFSQGKIGAMAMGAWAISQFEDAARENNGDPDDVGYMPYPFVADDGKMYSQVASDYTVAIAKNTKNKEASQAFVDWFLGDFNYAAKSGYIPPKKGMSYPPKIQAFEKAGVLLVEEEKAVIDGSLSTVEKNAKSSATDDTPIVIWGQEWVVDFATTAFDVRDGKSTKTIKELLLGVQAEWNNGINELKKDHPNPPSLD
ncbi:MAG TPA: ABC transporter substrate-binding protein [Clostridia bacterium]